MVQKQCLSAKAV